MIRYFLLLFILLLPIQAQTIEFPSQDSLMVTADLYLLDDTTAPFIVLFHQAGWSRGEYLEIAPKLNKMGFSCMAVDQRSGNLVNEVKNLTAQRAIKEKKKGEYIHAIPDMLAAIEYIKNTYKPETLIGWGSSYSSALILKLAGDDKELVDGVLSFAPGEYFERLGKSADWITKSAKNIECPVFITSAKVEKSQWIDIYTNIKSKHKTMYLPETEGNHGSRALWEKFDDNIGYWKAVTEFLLQYK